MKKIFIIMMMLLMTGCGSEANVSSTEVQIAEVNMTNEVTMQIGNKTFNIVLENNPAVEALIKKLPLNVEMKELNGNEKYYQFKEHFPSNDINPKMIHTGDLMLYSGSYLVLFYKDFKTNYNYTRIGHVANVEGLVEAVGSGNIHVTIKK